MKISRDAFQILFANARALSKFSTPMEMSVPGDAPRSKAMRTASVPYLSVTSSGSMTLPFVFDIFCPSASRTIVCRYTTRNGMSPVHSRPSMIMRATQKKRMSKPVISNDVG